MPKCFTSVWRHNKNLNTDATGDGLMPKCFTSVCRHNKNLNTDAWRKIQLWRHTANPEHPIHRFATGNLQTLLHTPKVGPACEAILRHCHRQNGWISSDTVSCRVALRGKLTVGEMSAADNAYAANQLHHVVFCVAGAQVAAACRV